MEISAASTAVAPLVVGGRSLSRNAPASRPLLAFRPANPRGSVNCAPRICCALDKRVAGEGKTPQDPRKKSVFTVRPPDEFLDDHESRDERRGRKGIYGTVESFSGLTEQEAQRVEEERDYVAWKKNDHRRPFGPEVPPKAVRPKPPPGQIPEWVKCEPLPLPFALLRAPRALHAGS